MVHCTLATVSLFSDGFSKKKKKSCFKSHSCHGNRSELPPPSPSHPAKRWLLIAAESPISGRILRAEGELGRAPRRLRWCYKVSAVCKVEIHKCVAMPALALCSRMEWDLLASTLLWDWDWIENEAHVEEWWITTMVSFCSAVQQRGAGGARRLQEYRRVCRLPTHHSSPPAPVWTLLCWVCCQDEGGGEKIDD